MISPKKRPKIVLGLDIGSYSIKVCLVKTEQDTKELVDFSIKAVKNSQTKEAIQNALSSLTSLSLLRKGGINISAGTEGVVVRQIIFPKMTEDELNSALKFEAEKYIPFKISEAILDCQILKQDIEPGKMLVLLAAARKDIIQKRMGLTKELGFKINLIDADILSLTNAFNFLSPEADKKVFALLNMGHSASSLVVIKEGLPFISRDIFIAGKDIDKLSSEIRMSFDYFENQSGMNVEDVYLSGGVSKLEDLDKFFENSLGVKVHHWDTFHNLKVSDEKKFKEALPELVVALGLALR